MKVLFMIPKNDPPRLEGNFSPRFADFVARCLLKNPQDRPTAHELLQHPFIRASKHISNLTELLERNQFDDCVEQEQDDGRAARFHNGVASAQRTRTDVLEAATSYHANDVEQARSNGTGRSVTWDEDNGVDDNKCHTRSRPSPVDSGWDFNTVRLSTTAASALASTSKPPVAKVNFEQPGTSSSTEWTVAGGLEDSGITLSSSMASALGSSSEIEADSPLSESTVDDPDAEAFESIVKPAIFEVLDRVVTARGAAEMLPSRLDREEALAASDEKESLLFDLLHSFDSLTQQRGLLQEVLGSLVDFAQVSVTPPASNTNAERQPASNPSRSSDSRQH